MGIPTLILAQTAADDVNIDFTANIDSTYDEYMFVCTDINPSQTAQFGFQVNVAGESGFNETITSTVFDGLHTEDDGTTAFAYSTGEDQAQGTAFQNLGNAYDSAADSSGAVILHLFSPSNTTYVKHFYARTNHVKAGDASQFAFAAGYINATGAVDEISFKVYPAGTFTGVIQMYGIA
tara:strand:- start:123 stop:659 length:537 start_codon:yes stop_codon:yes gene_type:complete